VKINPKKIIKKSEKIADFPEAVRYKKDKFKYYWAHFRWPSLKQWKELPKILTKKEKLSFIAFLMIFLISASYLSYSLYLAKTDIVPTKGGEYKEGIVGNPRFINPIYSDFSDVDRDTVELIFSGLTRYTPEGKIVPDMADNIKTEEEGKKVTVTLKEGLFWADGQEITTDDVVFTIEKIQDPDYKSSLRTNWLGVKAEKISDKVVSFTLKKPFGAFKERLTLKIIPKHIWEDISPENFPLSLFNLKPVGSGPYKIKELEQNNEGFIKSLSLERNELYHGQEPYISNIDLLFFESEEEILKAWKNRVIDGFSLTSLEKVSDLNYNFLSNQENFNIYYFSLPRYFSVFFNLGVKNNSEILKEEKIREAINYGTDKEQILNSIAEGKGVTVDSPILPKIFGFNEPQTKYEFNLEKAKQILEDAGFKETERGTREREIKESAPFEFKSTLQVGSEGQEVRKLQECLSDEKLVDPSIYPSKKVTGYFGQETKQAVINFQEEYYQDILKPWGFESGTGIVYRTTREKLNEVCFQPEQKFTPLKFTLKTAENELLIKVANILKDQWQKFGLELEIEIYPISQFENEVIKTRDYQMLLFGESLGIIPDPYPFWHSSQEKNPGLNLIGYEDKEADELLEEARGTLDPKERAQKLQTFQEIIIKDAPCVFLFSPDYLHFISKSIKGISQKVVADPSKRFIDVESWYIKTKRALPKE
jgi:peptide/nickel transport system substrate-binding protein